MLPMLISFVLLTLKSFKTVNTCSLVKTSRMLLGMKFSVINSFVLYNIHIFFTGLLTFLFFRLSTLALPGWSRSWSRAAWPRALPCPMRLQRSWRSWSRKLLLLATTSPATCGASELLWWVFINFSLFTLSLSLWLPKSLS